MVIRPTSQFPDSLSPLSLPLSDRQGLPCGTGYNDRIIFIEILAISQSLPWESPPEAGPVELSC